MTDQPFINVHAGKIHALSSGRKVIDISYSWARFVDEALTSILDASPELRHISIELPKADQNVSRLFHSDDGSVWKQVHLASFGSRRRDIRWIVRGAQELDGDPSFTTDLSADNLDLREIVGKMLAPRDKYRRPLEECESLQAWAERRIRPVLDYAGELYVEGGGSDEAQNGRRQALITINRLLLHLRFTLRQDKEFVFPARGKYDSGIETSIQEFVLQRHLPFVSEVWSLRYGLPRTKEEKRKCVKKVWANAARMPSNARFDSIYGALLRQAEGHPIYGNAEYQRLEEYLSADLAAGYRVIQLDGRLFIHSRGRWRAGRLAPLMDGGSDWTRGTIISRNYGRVIVPPFDRDGALIPGYTRNGPGEGPSLVRNTPVEMKCISRPVKDTNLNWIHAYHAWELEQVGAD